MEAEKQGGATKHPLASAPPGPPSAPPPLRHVDRSRHASTCAFADAVARASIAAYRALPPPPTAEEEEGGHEEGLTVVSAVLVRAVDGALRVVALGAGTKYPPAAARAAADAATLVRRLRVSVSSEEDGLVHPADTTRTNRASAPSLRRLSKP